MRQMKPHYLIKPKGERDKKGWEKQFNEKFPNGYPNGANWWFCPAKELYQDAWERVENMRKVMKIFIQKELDLAYKKGAEEERKYIGKNNREAYSRGYEEGFESASKQKRVAQKAYLDLKEELKKKIEEMRKRKDSKRTTDEKRYPIGYNQALSDILSTLTKKEEEYLDIKRKDIRGKFKLNIDLRKLRGSTPINQEGKEDA